ncbi:MAG: cytochrome c [Thermoleophilia bacterium]|nr:cytochrome c [Thermoleophilia bacterium]
MRKLKLGMAVLASAALLGVAAGCGGSDESESQTPSEATTAVNSAAQTDSEGQTVTTPPATETATETGGGTDTAGGGETEEASGDVAAGETKFNEVCAGCHPNGGQQAGVGPQLAGAGLALAAVKTTIQNGRGAMPAGLVSGDDLENVAAYVESIQ